MSSFCCGNLRQVTGRVQSKSRSDTAGSRTPLSLPLCPRPPSCQGEKGHQGPQLSVLTMPTGEQAIFVNVCLITYRRIAVQPSLQGPFSQNLLHGWSRVREASEHCPRYWSSYAMWLQQSIAPQGAQWPLRKTLNGSHCLTAALLQRCSNVGEKDRAELHQKGKVLRETLTPGLGLWSPMWHQELDMIKVKRKRLRSVYSTSHLPPSSITCFLKSSFF